MPVPAVAPEPSPSVAPAPVAPAPKPPTPAKAPRRKATPSPAKTADPSPAAAPAVVPAPAVAPAAVPVTPPAAVEAVPAAPPRVDAPPAPRAEPTRGGDRAAPVGDADAPRRPRLVFRIGAAGFIPTAAIYPSPSTTDPDLELAPAPSLALDLALRVAGPVHVYLTGTGGIGSMAHSNTLALGTAVPKPTYTTTSVVGTAGLLLEPTFGRSPVQPYVRAGGGMVANWITLPVGTAYSVAPAVDAGGGLRFGRGRFGGFFEARWLGSSFKSSYLPLAAGAPARNTAQSDILTLIGLRIAR